MNDKLKSVIFFIFIAALSLLLFFAVYKAAILIEASESADTKLNFATLYSPDGSVIAKGQASKISTTNGYITFIMNGTQYQTSWENVIFEHRDPPAFTIVKEE